MAVAFPDGEALSWHGYVSLSLCMAIEGLPTIVLAFAIRCLLPGSPGSSEFLMPTERQWLR
eukprot:scaffold367491_cov20-Prasinocladus_malaysianus.AAC.1